MPPQRWGSRLLRHNRVVLHAAMGLPHAGCRRPSRLATRTGLSPYELYGRGSVHQLGDGFFMDAKIARHLFVIFDDRQYLDLICQASNAQDLGPARTLTPVAVA